jgi:hypothetical protein
LPMFNGLTERQIRFVCSSLDEAVRSRSAPVAIHARAS